jgi:hypothetical protein
MTRISVRNLHRAIIGKADSEFITESDLSKKPLLFCRRSNPTERYRLYAFNLTSPPGGRTVGEHKIQLILPGHIRGQRSEFDRSDDRYVLLAGYSASLSVISLWDSFLYSSIAYSRNVQIDQSTVIKAFTVGRATQSRIIRGEGTEEVVAGRIEQFNSLLEIRRKLTLDRLLNS